MKAYKTLCGAILVATTIVSAAIFERASPVLWEVSDKVVSPGPTYVKIRSFFTSPCAILQQVGADPSETQEAVNSCQEVFQDNVLSRVQLFSDKSNNVKLPLQPQPVQPATYQQPGQLPISNLPPAGFVQLQSHPTNQVPPQGTPISPSGQHQVGNRDIPMRTSGESK